MSDPHHSSGSRHWLLAILPLGLAIYFFSLSGRVAAGDYPHINIPWVPDLNIDLAFRVDGLSLIMALLVTGIGALILSFASGYMAGDPQINRFFVILLLFMGAMLGLVLADNIIMLFIFWELTSITSYLLIGFNHESDQSQKSALQALLVTGSGGMALMAGLVLLSVVGGSWQLSELLDVGYQTYSEHPLYTAALILVLIGCFTKSAQFPFHFWLPNAMAAPTPVSAYLHSATMVKAGVYLLARLNPILGHTDAWFYTLVIFGGVTGMLGAWLCWQQHDLKRIMAYSTISALGTLVFLIGLGETSEFAYKAAVVFLIVHSLYKGALFMTAGSVDHGTGTRDVTRLGGLMRPMPYTFAGVLLATISMAGFPPLLGFVGKELIYEATIESINWATLLSIVALVTNILMVTAAGIILIEPFFRSKKEDSQYQAHEASWQMWIGPVLLGVIALVAGLFVESQFFSQEFVQPAVSAIAGKAKEVELHLIPVHMTITYDGHVTAFFLSLMTWAVGIGLYVVHKQIRPWAQRFDETISVVGPEQGYFKGLDGVLDFAKYLTKYLQNGHMRYYILFVLLTLALVVGTTLVDSITTLGSVTDVSIHEILLSLLIIAALIMITNVRSRLAAVAGMGVVGYGIALFYLLFSAPDLAMTQFSIETLTVILFVLVLYRLPKFETISRPLSRLRDAIISLIAGSLMSLFILTVTAQGGERPLKEKFAAIAYTEARGENIVNVILVDFRGLDTMVEIVVLGVAAIGVYALIKSRNSTEDKEKQS